MSKKQYFWRFDGNENRYLNVILKRGLRPKKGKNFNLLLEKKWSKLHKLKYSMTVNSCTSGLHAGLCALSLKKGDEVLIPALTPVMPANAIIFAGLKPVFVDVEPDTFLIDPKDLEKKITKKSKAVLLVHLYGNVCDSRTFQKIAKKYNLRIIEDCAESLVAKDKNGVMAGTMGDFAVWSFQSAKHITCGDGGIISTSNPKIAMMSRKYSNLGYKFLQPSGDRIIVSKRSLQRPSTSRYSLIGYNYRMNEFSAAIALAQTERINHFIKMRRYVSLKMIKEINRSKILKAQVVPKKAYSTFYTLSAVLSKKIKWIDFQKKFILFGGDSFYAASKIVQDEPSIKNSKYKLHKTPVAKKLQKQIINFCTNQGSIKLADKQLKALKKTINYFS
mgnify:CR=1 FL=1